ncbi:MAG: tyrosine-protein phosphatase [Deltaproteobacteria bacterium]|nr:tyrosine-protein phosphatase [Deltaproteobacteria bacterium]MBW2142237.1 tyrosine-protein phosphatase [Deltaproteobacteria bacterium]MBW2324828.1 tyrosine-protein phosphatase [Deltaproteobacteria bacterium]
MPQNEIRLSKLEVEREDGAYRISWEASPQVDSVTIYTGTTPEGIDHLKPLNKVTGASSATISGLDSNVRHYFEVVPEGGRGLIAAQRLVNLKGSINFRDLGGYETHDGRRVKWGHIYRSDSLARLTDEDQACLSSLGLRLVCDFRSPIEVEKGPDKLPADGSIEYLHLPIYDGAFDPIGAFERIKQGDVSWLSEEFMINGYINNIENFGPTWGTVIKRLVEGENRPLVWHCTGGKDRAGQFSALVLLALGVPEETVIYDHGLTNIYIADRMTTVYERIKAMGVDPEKLTPWFTAPPSFIINMLDHLRRTYGAIDEYLRVKTGIDDDTIALLKDELLE